MKVEYHLTMQRRQFIWLLAASPLAAQQKRRVAVFDFEYGTVQSGVQAIFNTNVDIGKGISDMIVEKLVNGGFYSVIERKALSKLVSEQNFSNSDRADPNSAAKIGRLLGVDAIIIGSITQFGRDDKKTNIGGGAIGGLAGRYGIGGVGRTSSKAAVGLSARIVSVDTAEVLAVARGKGESARTGTSLLGAGGSSTNAGGGAVDMASSNFANTLLGEATGAAVTQLINQLHQNSTRIATKVVAIDALVADVSGSTLIINLGSRAGVKVGDKLQVKRMGKAITDPATGKVLKRREDLLGELKITEVDEVSATGSFAGSGKPAVGDAAKNN